MRYSREGIEVNVIAVKMNILFGRMLSALPAEGSRSNGDIILSVLLGMVFITVVIWLAAIIAGKIGSRFHPTGWLADKPAGGEEAAADENPGNNENENNDIGGNING